MGVLVSTCAEAITTVQYVQIQREFTLTVDMYCFAWCCLVIRMVSWPCIQDLLCCFMTAMTFLFIKTSSPDQDLAWNPLRGLAYRQETMALTWLILARYIVTPQTCGPPPRQCVHAPTKVLVLSISASSDWSLAVFFPVLFIPLWAELPSISKHTPSNGLYWSFALPQCREAWLVPKRWSRISTRPS